MTFLRAGKTRSGDPGRSRRCKRYRYPIPWSIRRTDISGAVSRWRTAAMILDRVAGLNLSAKAIGVACDGKESDDLRGLA